MRGKAWWRPSAPHKKRITPAYAGKRKPPPARPGIPADHPRVCGEKTLYRGMQRVVLGSPPRMRGKEVSFLKLPGSTRITPAYAGKSVGGRGGSLFSQDHPRVCGEKRCWYWWKCCSTGSPPRMRGKDGAMRKPPERFRITPAYAGKSPHPHRQTAQATDHPRVCGEKRLQKSSCRMPWGSPPRMRGKEGDEGVGAADSRITPAYAGKSLRARTVHAKSWDHPRVCGEKTPLLFCAVALQGSPPRMRGKAAGVLYAVCARGITPAYAGKRWMP